MARTAVRPRPVGTVHRLPPRPVTYLRDCLLWLTAAIAAAGGLPLLDAGPVLTIMAVAGCLAAAALTVAAGRRTQARRELHDRLTEALAPVLEMPHPDRAAVRLTRWRGRRPGHPTRIVLVYNARAVDTDPLWRSEITTICTRRLGSGYQISRHQQRRCRLILRAVPLPDDNATPHVQRRAERTITELLGPTATMSHAKWRENEFAGFTVTHQAGAKLAVAGYRNRVERIVSAMLPGRWRAHWDLEADTVRFELRPTLPTYLPHPSIHIDDSNRDRIPIAVSEDGEVVAWNLRGTGPMAMVIGRTGTGKALALDTPIPTPSGWTTMGKLRAGDLVFDESGRPCTVTAAHPIRHGRPCYEVEFNDGSVIVADAEHLWFTSTRAERISATYRRNRATRPTRLPQQSLAAIAAELAAASEDTVLSAPEAARIAGITDTHPALRSIVAQLPIARYQQRPTLPYHYRGTTVLQRQHVAVFDRTQAIQVLTAAAPRCHWPNADQLQHASHSDGDGITAREIAALIGVTVDRALHLMRHGNVPATRQLRDVPCQIKRPIVYRSNGGPPVAQYNARQLLTALQVWGQGMTRDRAPRPVGAVRSTSEIAATLRSIGGQANHSIAVGAPLQCPDVDLPIPPYTLGAWLGDGSSWHPVLTSADPEIAQTIAAEGISIRDAGTPNGQRPGYAAREYRMTGGIAAQLRQLGLLRRVRHRDRVKHIPAPYLRASIQQRRALLAGLLDTDGTVAPGGAVQFTTTSSQLAADVHELALSLGYRATSTEGRAKLRGRDYGPKWTIGWTTQDHLFRLPRKAELHRQRTARFNPERNRHRYITNVRPVPSVPVRCITVDSPNHLYLAGRAMIPTHNTVVLNGMVMECAARGWPVWVLDPKRIEFMGLRDWPGVQIVATSIEDQIAVIYRAWEEMEHRYTLIESGQAVESDFQPLIVVLDEYRDFAGMATDWYARIKVRGMPTKCPVFEKVSSIARKGRSARVHAILGVQRPDAEWLGGEMRDNFATRISLGRLSPQGAQMMWDQAWIGVSVPKGIPGRATAVSDDDRPLEVQAYWTPDPRRAIHHQHADDLQLLTDLLPAEEQHPKLAVQLAEELLNPLDDDGQPTGTPQTWDAVLTAQLVPSLEPPAAMVEQLRVKTPLTPLQAKLAAAHTTRPTSASSTARHPPLAPDPVDDLDLGDGYAAEVTTTAARLQPGDLICTDDGDWVVVETAEHDVETGEFIVDWRSDVDDFGSITLPSDSPLRARRPDLTEEDLT